MHVPIKVFQNDSTVLMIEIIDLAKDGFIGIDVL